MLYQELEATEKLGELSIDAGVVNISSVKPLDEETIIREAERAGNVITIEDHSVYGGIGSAVAELLSQKSPARMKIIGVDNKFGRSGKPEELYNLYKLSTERIIEEARIITGK